MQAERPKSLIDPVCGMSVDVDEAEAAGLLIESEDRTYAFCRAACRNTFLADPMKFIAAAQAAEAASAAIAQAGGTVVIDEGMRRWYESCSCCLSDAYPDIRQRSTRATLGAAGRRGTCEVAELRTSPSPTGRALVLRTPEDERSLVSGDQYLRPKTPLHGRAAGPDVAPHRLVLQRLGRPRWLWIAAWALIPLLSPVVISTAVALSRSGLEWSELVDLAATQVGLAWACLIFLWGGALLGRQASLVRQDLPRLVPGDEAASELQGVGACAASSSRPPSARSSAPTTWSRTGHLLRWSPSSHC
jgi:YHS domain-containing protein